MCGGHTFYTRVLWVLTLTDWVGVVWCGVIASSFGELMTSSCSGSLMIATYSFGKHYQAINMTYLMIDFWKMPFLGHTSFITWPLETFTFWVEHGFISEWTKMLTIKSWILDHLKQIRWLNFQIRLHLQMGRGLKQEVRRDLSNSLMFCLQMKSSSLKLSSDDLTGFWFPSVGKREGQNVRTWPP